MKKEISANFLSHILILVYFALACFKLQVPGIQTDEIIFGNISLGLVNNTTHVFSKIGSLPVLELPYIGAIKAYLYYPIFKIFGVNYWSIRFPMILLIGLSLYYFYKSILFAFKNQLLAILCLLLMCTDLTLIIMTRNDVGPVAIEFFFKIIITYLLVKFLNSKDLKYIYFLPIVFLAGLSNKLKFVWFLNGFIFSLVFFYYDIFFSKVKRKTFIILALVFIVNFMSRPEIVLQ